TGGIACYKIPNLIRLLVKQKAEVRVIMTEAATKFITPLTLETVSGNPVEWEMFPANQFVATRHIDLAEWPDLFVIAPATANFLGKVSGGISDDLLTTILCATAKPVLIAPAMNPQMWRNKVTRRNYDYVKKELGFLSVGPAEGEMACDAWGVGRMAEPEEIFSAVESFFLKSSKKKVLTGKKILVTAGPCREAIDPVRYISNRSSGKMGYALARAARELGAETTVISGPTDLTAPNGVHVISVETTDQMAKAVLKHFPRSDCLIMAAAPADFVPETPAKTKIKKDGDGLTLKLRPTVDILKEVAKVRRKGQFVVGFALETDNDLANARRKLAEKKLDLIVVNNPTAPGAGFEHDTNKVMLITPGKSRPENLPLMSKSDLANRILDIISSML
ncbi:MAG: bifunctional phosphopantothenoylcysteine decarboxylase/phosphopantothenate--cysteine ligase CoaBC, partial [candidate division Zixibacteria bacterium]|nr:bifunctional phosphopantothenoylcysteine decarboxylase/phosphopantothenate--cysteine ligase CoaBC [candidate division Zixibacteria bacterium]